jgi:hypothetical protein
LSAAVPTVVEPSLTVTVVTPPLKDVVKLSVPEAASEKLIWSPDRKPVIVPWKLLVSPLMLERSRTPLAEQR